jgi:SAM-dependent methyltransferase
MGFDPNWLALRAGFDTAARATALEARLAWHVAGRHDIRVVDLGAGTGAGLVHLAPRLGARLRQSWCLVERDPVLIAAGRARLAVQPEAADVAVDWLEADLAAADLAPVLEGADLVHFTALIDLAGRAWLEDLAGALARAGAPVLGALTWDGRMVWDPAAATDADAVAGFARHQRRDKGLGGPALGPDAAPYFAEALRRHGFEVTLARSDWVIGPEHPAMHQAMVDGVAGALVDLVDGGEAPAGLVADFRAGRAAAGPGRLVVGHLDLLGIPPSPA